MPPRITFGRLSSKSAYKVDYPLGQMATLYAVSSVCILFVARLQTVLTISNVAFADHSIIDKKLNACLLVPGIEIPLLHGGPPDSAVVHAEGAFSVARGCH